MKWALFLDLVKKSQIVPTYDGSSSIRQKFSSRAHTAQRQPTVGADAKQQRRREHDDLLLLRVARVEEEADGGEEAADECRVVQHDVMTV